MTPAETITILRQFNEWRLGDEDLPQPDSKQVTAAIYAAIEMIERAESDLSTAEQDSRQKQARIERLEKIEAAAQNLVKMKGRHNTEVAYQRLVAALEETK